MTAQRIKSRVFALFAVMVAFVSCAVTAPPALAANTPPTDNLTTTFSKYLVMDENASVPNVEFEFTITAGDAVDGSENSLPIYAGIGNPTVESAVFSTGDTTTQGTPTNSGATGYKYAKKEVTVDFSNVTFNSPGIYRYIITEGSSTTSGIINDTTATRTLDVYVESNDTGGLSVAGYFLHEDNAKSTGFTNEYATYDLTLKKNVTGNQGDRDKYFEFTVEIANAAEGTVYSVDLSGADENLTVDGTEKTNPKSLTVLAGGTVKATFYLKHEQSIVIQGLTSNTTYTITETDYASDGYTTSYEVNSGGSVESSTTGSQTMGADDHTVTFTNDKNGAIPTGILLETTPYLVMGGVVIAGLVALVATRRRRASRKLA